MENKIGMLFGYSVPIAVECGGALLMLVLSAFWGEWIGKTIGKIWWFFHRR